MKVALLGSTGLVGKNVLSLLARLSQVVHVYCPVRMVPDLGDFGILQGASKIHFEQVNFEQVSGAYRQILMAGFLGCDAVICCLGTTKKQAGSKVAQEKVDVRLPLSLAAIAKSAGVTMMNFETLTLVRPSLLLGKHKDKRFGEELLQKTIGAHPEWIPAYVRPVHAETVAAHLVASLLKPPTDHICATDGVKGKRIIYNRVLAQTKVSELF